MYLIYVYPIQLYTTSYYHTMLSVTHAQWSLVEPGLGAPGSGWCAPGAGRASHWWPGRNVAAMLMRDRADQPRPGPWLGHQPMVYSRHKLGPCQLGHRGDTIFAPEPRPRPGCLSKRTFSVCKDAHFPIKSLTVATFLIYFTCFPIYAADCLTGSS